MITIADIGYALNPAGVANKFQTSGISANAQAQILANVKGYIYAFMPSTYQPFCTTIPGLVLTRDATSGTTVFTLPTACQNAVPANCYVWVNPSGLWRDRKRASADAATFSTTSCTLATATGEGDMVVAEVAHDFTNAPAVIKKWALDIGVNEVVLRFPSLQIDAELRMMYAERLTQTREDLREFHKGNLRIKEWDDLDIIDENETVSRRGEGVYDTFTTW